MQMIEVTTDNQVTVVDLSFDDLREKYQSPVEHVKPRRLGEPYCLLIDEEGLLKELPINMVGSFLYETDKHGNPIVGDIYFAKEGWTPNGYDIVGLNNEDIEILKNIIYQILKIWPIMVKQKREGGIR